MVRRSIVTASVGGSMSIFVAATNAATYDEFNDGVVAWSANNITSLAESGGVMSGTQNGTDPFVSRTSAPNAAKIEGLDNTYVHLRMKVPSTMSNSASLFWDDTNGFVGGQSAGFTTTNDGAFHDYVINLSGNTGWTGLTSINALRVDPTNGPGTGQFQLDYVRISSSSTNSYQYVVDGFGDGSAAEWTMSSNMLGGTESGGVYTRVNPGNDPFMSRPILDVNGTLTPIVRVTMSVSGGTGTQAGQIFWENEDGTYTAARSANFNVIADGVMRTYEIDLSADPDWAGKTIDGFRLDPTGTANTTISVNHIEIVAVPEPGSVMLAGLGLLLMLPRRRR